MDYHEIANCAPTLPGHPQQWGHGSKEGAACGGSKLANTESGHAVAAEHASTPYTVAEQQKSSVLANDYHNDVLSAP